MLSITFKRKNFYWALINIEWTIKHMKKFSKKLRPRCNSIDRVRRKEKSEKRTNMYYIAEVAIHVGKESDIQSVNFHDLNKTLFPTRGFDKQLIALQSSRRNRGFYRWLIKFEFEADFFLVLWNCSLSSPSSYIGTSCTEFLNKVGLFCSLKSLLCGREVVRNGTSRREMFSNIVII